MGWIRHHGIVVTCWNEDALNVALTKAIEVFGHEQVSEAVLSPSNGYRSFLVAPDGSKEGWPESAAGDAARGKYIAWLGEQAYEDGSSALEWLEYEHDVDNKRARIRQFVGSGSTVSGNANG